MALSQPSNCFPSTLSGETAGTVAAAQYPIFSWQVNGDMPLQEWEIKIYDAQGRSVALNSGSLPSGSTFPALPFAPTDEKGNPRQYKIVFPYNYKWQNITLTKSGITPESKAISDGNNYTWTVRQFYGWNGVVNATQQYSPSFFRTLSVPSLQITQSDGDTPLEKHFTATYSQAQQEGINWVRWTVGKYSLDTGLEIERVDDTGEINTSTLNYAYSNFERTPRDEYDNPIWYYGITCKIETAGGMTAHALSTLELNYDVFETSDLATVTCAKDNASIVAWPPPAVMPGEVTPNGAYHISNNILHLNNGATAKWQNKGDATTLGLLPPYAACWRGKIKGFNLVQSRPNYGIGSILCSAFSPDGNWFFAGGSAASPTASSGKVFDATTRNFGEGYALLNNVGATMSQEIKAAAFSPDSQHLAVFTASPAPPAIHLYELENNIFVYKRKVDLTSEDADRRASIAFWDNTNIMVAKGVAVDKYNMLDQSIAHWTIGDTPISGIAVGETIDHTKFLAAVTREKLYIVGESGSTLAYSYLFHTGMDNNKVCINPKRKDELLCTTPWDAIIYHVYSTGGEIHFNAIRDLNPGSEAATGINIDGAAFNALGDTLAIGYGTVNDWAEIVFYDAAAANADYSRFNAVRIGNIGEIFSLSTLSISRYGNMLFVASGSTNIKLQEPAAYSFPSRSLFKFNAGTNVIEAKITNFHIYVTLTSNGTPQTSIVCAPYEYSGADGLYIDMAAILLEQNVIIKCKRGNSNEVSTYTFFWDTEQTTIESIEIYGEQECQYIYVSKKNAGSEEIWDTPVNNQNTLFLANFKNDLQAGSLFSPASGNIQVYIYAKDGNGIKSLGHWHSSVGALKDYGLLSQTPRRYLVQYVSGTDASALFEAPPESQPAICRRFTSYTLIEAEIDETSPNIYHVRRVWEFGTNLQISEVSDNYKPTFYENFTKYPLRQRVTPSPKSGTLTGLLNNPTGGEYFDTAEQIKALYDISDSPYTFFLKDMKGEIYMVHTSAPITTHINTRTGVQETTISIPWQETGSTDGVAVIQLRTSPYWED